jgi:hypothetical protein
MITLPGHITTTMLQSFWIVLWTFFFGIISIFSVIVLNSYVYLMMLLLIPIFSLPGYLYPEFIVPYYQLMNRILNKIKREIRKLVLAVIHQLFLKFLKIESRNNSVSIDPPSSGSLWQEKTIENLIGENGTYDVSIDLASGKPWYKPFLLWIMRTKKWWILPVIPFSIILSFLSDESEKQEQKAVAHDTYTLY